MSFIPICQAPTSNWAPIRLIATDMDGTLTQAGKFTPSLLQALQDLKQVPIPVVIVTGRSAGWVQGIASYLPIAGAIAENGGIYYGAGEGQPEGVIPLELVSLDSDHRAHLATVFRHLQGEFPHIQESSDNRFRLTDWTFDLQGLNLAELQQLGDRCRAYGWGFTYSTVQCHIKPPRQNKAEAVESVLSQFFPQIATNQVLTVGDSPNDESLFDPRRFPCSIGVANSRHYRDQLAHLPTYITDAAEVDGFCELVRSLLKAMASSELTGNTLEA